MQLTSRSLLCLPLLICFACEGEMTPITESGRDAGADSSAPQDGSTADSGAPVDGSTGMDSGADGAGTDSGPVDDELRAFPTARGAGAYITGGRGGTVVPVTRLDDAHDEEGNPVEGTLRYALRQPFTRTIVFRVSGTIVIGDRDGDGVMDEEREREDTYPGMLSLEREEYSNFTVAGQTAPEGGITIRGHIYSARVTNMIWRYVRIRKNAQSDRLFDALSLNGTRDVVLDHMSIAYGTDEGASITSSHEPGDAPQSGITIQNNLIALSKTGSITGGISSMGMGETSVIQNFYSNISHRFPNIAGEGRSDVINNLAYNWRNRLVNVHNGNQVNHINNAYVAGARTRTDTDEVANKVHMGTEGILNARIYTAGNFITRLLTEPDQDNWVSWQVFVTRNGYEQGDPAPAELQADSAFAQLGSPLSIRTAAEIIEQLPNEVGAFQTLTADGSVVSYRDALDTEFIAEYEERRGGNESLDQDSFVYPAVPENAPYEDTDGDGMPNVWESANGFDPDTVDGADDADENGYTNLEEFLNLVDVR